MTKEQMAALKTGDIVRHKHSADAMIVTSNRGATVELVRAQTMSNPAEWDLILQANHKEIAR